MASWSSVPEKPKQCLPVPNRPRKTVVSAIIAVKNGAQWLPDCLDSLLAQDLPSEVTLQISIYDDGSTDNTTEVIEEYSSKFEKNNMEFRFSFGKQSRGVGFAKNAAVRNSDGEYLCFCDADDISDPNRIRLQIETFQKEHGSQMPFIGCKFRRLPENSTERYTNWANSLNESQLVDQRFTSHGPTLAAPTWFMSRKFFELVGGFYDKQRVGYPEDLKFFYDANRYEGKFIRVDECLVTYRYHPKCASFNVSDEAIWQMRIDEFQRRVLPKWTKFTIWSAGKQGKRLYKSLTEENRAKVVAFCDVDKKKIARGKFEFFDERSRSVTATVPIISIEQAQPPVAICVKMGLTGGVFEKLLAEKWWSERNDFCHLG